MENTASNNVPPNGFRHLNDEEQPVPGDLHWNSDNGSWCELMYVGVESLSDRNEAFARKNDESKNTR